MARTPTNVPRYPNVPQAPGVPALDRIGRIASTVVLVASSIVRLLNYFRGPQWGIFSETGAPLLIGDAVVGVDLKADTSVPIYPIEKGGFGQYNKVRMPNNARATFTVGGSDAARAAFLATLQKLTDGLELVALSTPEISYKTMNIVAYNYRRTAQGGVSLLMVEVLLQEIRVIAGEAFQDATRAPSGANPQGGGTVQPVAPTSAQTAAAGANGVG